MSRNILSLDFYGGEITAALAALDEETSTLRLRHVLRRPTRAFSGAFVRDMQGAQEEISAVFSEISQYVSIDPSVVIGLRGNFLSFKRASGFNTVDSRNKIIGEREMQSAIKNSIPPNLSETLDVVDILPQTYTIEGNTGIKNPKGLMGLTLEVETFLSCALVTHLNNLYNALAASGCSEYQVLPTGIALGETLARPEERQAGVLVLDIGQNAVSALMYHKDALMDAWELPFGRDAIAQAVADLLQNDLETAREVLKDYEPGTDDIMDDVLEDAAAKLLQDIKKELLRSLLFLSYPPTRLVLCGEAADKNLLKTAKQIFGVRKARLASFDDLIADCPADEPVYCGAVSLLMHTLEREQKRLGVAQTKETGLLDGLLDKLGLSELF
ncbi:MAG: hypothetical protein ACI37O_06290 [Candidatus Avelusimicrobium sp.]|uniref:hypothetical protein n=1 Tax=Candidatus Avelusimicrobium sp. TaxID=3048833 RepID=UPI003F11ABA6